MVPHSSYTIRAFILVEIDNICCDIQAQESCVVCDILEGVLG